MKPKYIYDLFEYDKSYVSQDKILFKRLIQFLFLVLINKLQIPAVIRSLIGNHTTLYRDPEKTIFKYAKAIDKALLE